VQLAQKEEDPRFASAERDASAANVCINKKHPTQFPGTLGNSKTKKIITEPRVISSTAVPKVLFVFLIAKTRNESETNLSHCWRDDNK